MQKEQFVTIEGKRVPIEGEKNLLELVRKANFNIMTFCYHPELAAYGAVSGILYRIFPRRNWSVYVTLIVAMIAGRLVWGGVQFVMAGLQRTAFDRSLFLAGAVTNALPGILVQIILIPILVITMEKAKLTLNGTR